MRFISFDSEESWLAAACEEFALAARSAAAEGREKCHFCLAGGSTPAPLYRRLATSPGVASAFAGLGIELWLSDERAVPLDDVSRNGLLISECLSGAAWKPRLRLWPSRPREDAVAVYAKELEASLGKRPRWDLLLLGLGEDGHTASLFPGDPILAEELALTAPSTSPLPPHDRMSLTYPALVGARVVRFLVRGRSKAGIVEALARGDQSLPASRLEGKASVILFCEAD